MSQENQKTLLSALFDNETTLEETSKAEKLLAESASARQELQEIRELSALLKSVPQQKLPATFAATVIKQAISQVETTTDNSQAENSQARNSESSDSKAIWSWVSLAAMVASLLCLIPMFDSPSTPHKQTESHLARSDAKQSSRSESVALRSRMSEKSTNSTTESIVALGNTINQLESEELEEAPVLMKDRQTKFANNEAKLPGLMLKKSTLDGLAPPTVSSGAGSPGTVSPKDAGDSGGGFGEIPKSEAGREAVAASSAITASKGNPTSILNRRATSVDAPIEFSKQQIEEIQIGDVFPWSQEEANEVIVVEVTVVDVERSVDAFRVLLAKNETPERDAMKRTPEQLSAFSKENQDKTGPRKQLRKVSEKPSEATTAESSPESKIEQQQEDRQPGTSGLFAVYVQSESLHLAQTLQQLRTDQLVQELNIRPPAGLKVKELQLAQSTLAAPIADDLAQNPPAVLPAKLPTPGQNQSVPKPVADPQTGKPRIVPNTETTPGSTTEKKPGVRGKQIADENNPADFKATKNSNKAKDNRTRSYYQLMPIEGYKYEEARLAARQLPQAKQENLSPALSGEDGQRWEQEKDRLKEKLDQQYRQLSRNQPVRVLFVFRPAAKVPLLKAAEPMPAENSSGS